MIHLIQGSVGQQVGQFIIPMGMRPSLSAACNHSSKDSFMKRQLCLVVAVALAGTMSACSSQAPVQQANLGKTTNGMAMTAEYRWIMSQPREEGKKPASFICPEPSPDVAKAISTALAESLKVDVAHPSGVKVGVEEALRYQTAQSIAQLGKRFATMQILDRILYNDCVMAANGMATESTYAMNRAAFSTLVVTLFGIERASGEDQGSLPAISSPQLNDGTSGDNQKSQKEDVRQPAAPSDGAKKSPAPADTVAASKAMDDLNNSYKALATAIHSLEDPKPAKGSAAEKAAASLRKADTVVKAAVNQVGKAWGEVIKRESQVDSISDAIKASADAEKKLKDEKNTIDQAMTNANAAGSKGVDAGKKLKDVIDNIGKANTALGKLTPADASNAGGKKTQAGTDSGTCCRATISPEQAKAITIMQENFLNNEDQSKSLAACASFYDRHYGQAITENAFTRYCDSLLDLRIWAAREDLKKAISSGNSEAIEKARRHLGNMLIIRQDEG